MILVSYCIIYTTTTKHAFEVCCKYKKKDGHDVLHRFEKFRKIFSNKSRYFISFTLIFTYTLEFILESYGNCYDKRENKKLKFSEIKKTPL